MLRNADHKVSTRGNLLECLFPHSQTHLEVYHLLSSRLSGQPGGYALSGSAEPGCLSKRLQIPAQQTLNWHTLQDSTVRLRRLWPESHAPTDRNGAFQMWVEFRCELRHGAASSGRSVSDNGVVSRLQRPAGIQSGTQRTADHISTTKFRRWPDAQASPLQAGLHRLGG